MSDKRIVVEVVVSGKSLADVWRYWTEPEEIVHWNAASDDWHTPAARNDLRVGGTFSYTMAARDGSVSFDFEGTYDEVHENQLISYSIGDGRKVDIRFETVADGVKVVESFEPETVHEEELQRQGWQAILNRFKAHVESK